MDPYRDIVLPMRDAIDAFPAKMGNLVYGSFWDGLSSEDRKIILSGVLYRGEEVLVAGRTIRPPRRNPLGASLLSVLKRRGLIEYTFPPSVPTLPGYSKFFRLLPSVWREGSSPAVYLLVHGYGPASEVLYA